MPPKVKSVTAGALVPTAPREVIPSVSSKFRNTRTEKGTTTRALVLRNGKHGARGTGEIILMSRMTGREKLDLLAEDLVVKSSKAIMRPFRLEECLKIAESQCDVYVDDVANLRDAELFYRIIEAELQARNPPTRENLRKNPSYVATVVATRLHNSYMLASAWKLASETLNKLSTSGVTDLNIKTKLKVDAGLRNQYLALWDVVNTLVDLSQNRFSILATTTPHYAKFFRLRPTEGTDPGEVEYIFDWTDLRKAAESYIDSIIIELCFPRGEYPQSVLYQLLHDAVLESPRDVKRFPQALWDAVGDLSVSVQLKELLDALLFGAEGDQWKKQPRQMPQEYEDWFDAQKFSRKASEMFANFKDVIFPLEKTRKQAVLDTMWKNINLNYQIASGKDADALWGLSENFNYAPQWTSYFIPTLGDFDSDNNGHSGLTIAKKTNTRTTDTRRVTNGASGGLSCDSDMPPLQSFSETSADDQDDDDDDSLLGEKGDKGDETDENGYNTEEEDEIRELLREAMDVASEADWLSGANVTNEVDPFELEDHRGNPFLKLLGSLRGRMFSSNPKLKTTTKTQPRTRAGREGDNLTSSTTSKSALSTIPLESVSSSPGLPTRVATSPMSVIEDADEEDNITTPAKKKKKKKSKRKKKAEPSESLPVPPSLQSPPETLSSATISRTVNPVAVTEKTPSTAMSAASIKSVLTSPSLMSSTSTLATGQTTAQSGHSYVHSQNVKVEKKLKSRPDHASLFSNQSDEKKGFFSRFSLQKSKDKVQEMKRAKESWFAKLGKRANNLMHQLLRTTGEARGSMKWDDFVKLMKEMGFTYDPSTAGSSVRFDPPSKGDPPITFHKPHPDPTLQPHILREYAQKLKRRYGWDETDLAKLG